MIVAWQLKALSLGLVVTLTGSLPPVPYPA